MTAPHIVDPGRLLGQALSDASPDLMRTLLTTVINALMSSDADNVCGAEYGVASADRVNSRNGYRHRELDTRVGTIDVAIPKLRSAPRHRSRVRLAEIACPPQEVPQARPDEPLRELLFGSTNAPTVEPSSCRTDRSWESCHRQTSAAHCSTPVCSGRRRRGYHRSGV